MADDEVLIIEEVPGEGEASDPVGEETGLVPVGEILPETIVILPVRQRAIFPGLVLPFVLPEGKFTKAIDYAMGNNGVVGFLLVRDESIEDPVTSDLHDVGTVAKIIHKINMPDGSGNILSNCIKRFKVEKFIKTDPFFVARISYPLIEMVDDSETQAMTRSILSAVKKMSENNPLFSEEMKLVLANVSGAGRITDMVSSILNIKREELQDLLATFDVKVRMRKVLTFLDREMKVAALQSKIEKEVQDKLGKQQKEFFLREQLKAIQKELGLEEDENTRDIRTFTERLEGLEMGEEARARVEEGIDKLKSMDSRSAEYPVQRNYVDLLTLLPWGKVTEETLDLPRARRILDEDHCGLDEIKERIIEFLAVKALKRSEKGAIVCFVGPPGVGKTSLGKSVARAMNRKFFRFSLGGMRDEAEIKGHRRTYVGALPGKIIHALKIVGHDNPVVMLDEIDKLGTSFQGDPSSALLEVLDPEQNSEFRDHYLDVPYDLSKVFFITTANIMDTIPQPLLDRMEVMRLSGYIAEEKIDIGTRFLLPRKILENGLEPGDLKITKNGLRAIINGYAREAGVRTFEREIAKICRKVAVRKAGKGFKPVRIDKKDVEIHLGRPKFSEESRLKISKPGVVIGLAWTSFGGETLYVESIVVPGKGGLRLTGSLGEVMSESASIGFSYVLNRLDELGISKNFLGDREIHLHVPAGATPKDGPSAGITMATSLISLMTGKKVSSRLAMTGELTLVGKVLPIGGIREKVIAAKRAGIRKSILPAGNERDLEAIPEKILKGLTFHKVETMEEVTKIVFPRL